MGKTLVKTLVVAIELEKVESVGETLKDYRGWGTSEHPN